MYNQNKAQQSKNRVHISWDILYITKYIDDLDRDCSKCFANAQHSPALGHRYNQ